MKSNKEIRLELLGSVNEMWNLFRKVSKSNENKEQVGDFTALKVRFNDLLAKLASRDRINGDTKDFLSSASKLLNTDGVARIGEVVLSRNGNYGIMAILFTDGEIWIIKEFQFEEELNQVQPSAHASLIN